MVQMSTWYDKKTYIKTVWINNTTDKGKNIWYGTLDWTAHLQRCCLLQIIWKNYLMNNKRIVNTFIDSTLSNKSYTIQGFLILLMYDKYYTDLQPIIPKVQLLSFLNSCQRHLNCFNYMWVYGLTGHFL